MDGRGAGAWRRGGEGQRGSGVCDDTLVGIYVVISWPCSKNELNCRGMRYGYDRNDCETVF